MKQTEVRPGILVKKLGRLHKVNLATISKPELFEPIKIDKVWEKKLGFRKVNHLQIVTYLPLQDKWNYIARYSDGESHLMLENMEEAMSIPLQADYVHQVQNIYHALVGEELVLWRLFSEKEPPESVSVRVNLFDGTQYSVYREGETYTISEGTETIDWVELMSWQEE